jgi:hypothetical protein
MGLKLDHLFCMVPPDGEAARRVEAAGWPLDAGSAHAGQGTRNRRHAWGQQYLELLWVTDVAESRANPLRLDRRADWRTTGASPVGIALRGQVPEADAGDFWLYDALGIPIWIHRDNERAPARPLVFILDIDRRGARDAEPPGALRSVRITGPAPASIPAYEGPRIEQEQGPHHLELVAGDGQPLTITAALSIRG